MSGEKAARNKQGLSALFARGYLKLGHEDWRADLLALILLVSVLLGGLVFILGVSRAFMEGKVGTVIADSAAYVSLFALWFFDRIPYRIRAVGFGIVSYGLGVFLLATVGPAAQIYLLAFSVLITLLLGLGAGVFAIALTTTTLFGMGYLGQAAPGLLPPGWTGTLQDWMFIGLNFLFINAVLTLVVGAVIVTMERALKGLNRERTLLRQLVDTLPDGVFVKDLSGRYLMANRKGVELASRDREAELLGKSADDLFSPEIAARVNAEDRRIFRGESVIDRESITFDTKGEQAWLQMTKLPQRDAEGRIIGLIGYHREVTQQRRSEMLLEAERQILDMVADGSKLKAVLDRIARLTEELILDSSVAIMLLDPDGRRLVHGAAPRLPEEYCRAIDGMQIGPKAGSCGTAMHRGTVVIVSDIESDPLWEDYRAVARPHGLKACWSVPVRDAGGEVIASFALYYTMNKTPAPHELELITRFAKLVADAMERIRTRGELRERVKEMQCLYLALEILSDRVTPVPDMARRIVGLLASSLLHEDVSVAQIWLDGEVYKSEGFAAAAAFMRAPVSRNGREVGFVEVGYKAEREPQFGGEGPFLKEERTMLAAIASHVSRMLDERETARMLTQSERLSAVGELTGGIAHDFNNLLQVIMLNAEMMAKDLRDHPELGELARMTMDAAERGAALTHHLLAFARRQALMPRVTDVRELIAAMSGLLRRTLGAHIEIETMYEPDLWPALIDPSQLESAVLNLAINARDAMPDGGQMTIELGNVTLDESYAAWNDEVVPGEYLMVAVTDNGSGMDQETVRRAFEPFFTTKEVGRGSGLGLSMIYGFVKQSRGHVKIYTEPGQGTTIKLYLPRANASDAAEALPVAVDVVGGSERILLVEDDELVRKHVARQLESLGYDVTLAENGHAALAALETGAAFDLLFTDVVMPGGINGRQLAERVREKWPGIRVLFTSGYTENSIVHQGRLDPGVHLLNKPYRRAELAAKVREVLEEERG